MKEKCFKLILALMMAFASTIQYPVQLFADTEYDNAALNKTVTVSEETEGLEGINAVDGNVETKWEASQMDSHPTIIVDLGTEESIAKIDLKWADNYASQFKVFVAKADQQYTEIASVEENTESSHSFTVAEETTIQYVKVELILASGENTSAGISEIEVLKVKEVAVAAADYTAVDAALATVPADLSVYTEETAVAVTTAVNAVDRTKTSEAQEDVDAMAKAITDAVAALTLKEESSAVLMNLVDRTVLDEVMNQAAGLDEEKYTNESYSALEDAVNAANALDANATQDEVDAAAQAIENAIGHLVVRYVNLALNKTATASSSWNKTTRAANKSVDGNTSTRWGNNYESAAYKGGNHEETFTVDLGAKYTVDVVSIKWEAAYATSYTIQGSNDGVNFFKIKDVTGATGNTEIHRNLGDVKLQYVRLALHESSGIYGYSIWELEVYEGDPTATIYDNLALNKDVEVSSVFSGAEFLTEHINDGIIDTRWGSNYKSTEYKNGNYLETVLIDLEDTYNVDRIVLTFEDAYAKSYKIQTSTDGTTFTDATGVLSGSVGEQRLVDLNLNTRYIKVLLMEPATKYGYSIYELEVYESRAKDLQKAVAQLERKVNSVQPGTTEGTMAESDYQEYVELLTSAKAVLNASDSKKLDFYQSIIEVQTALSEFDSDIISGEAATVSVYPVPQNISVNSINGMKFTGTVDIVVHGTQDVATLPKLEKLLTDEGITYQYADAIGLNPAIVLAVDCGSDCDICDSITDANNALTHTQGYVLDSSNEINKKGQVTIVGHDADGVYYGVMTLIQMFNQKTSDGRIAEVTISDYPDVEFRGYVEGFYGIPWTFDDRANLFRDTSLYKMTTYIYAPKDDPYHRGKWRNLYPEAEANNIKALAEVAKENNMEFCWTIHPGADYNYTKDSDGDGLVDDYETILTKFEQVYSLGVRQFGIFYDDLDYDVANGLQHSGVINDAYEYLTDKYDDVKPFITVVTRYTNSWGAPWDTYFTPFMQNIHEDTIVLWTGQSTMSAITKAYMEYPQTKTGVDRDFGVWWNFPVTDYYYGHLLMGPLDCLSNDVDNINSFFLNPMSEADASKVAIYSGADYSWNTAAFNSKTSWSRAIEELVPEANKAFERFADNLAYVDKGNGFFFDESVYLKDKLSAFESALSEGLTQDDIAELKSEFNQMITDSEELRMIKNKALLDEIVQHLNAYKALGEAGVAAMEAFESALAGDISTTTAKKDVLEDKLTECNSYRIKKLSGTAAVSVGAYRIQPFLKNLNESIMAVLNECVDHSVEPRMISNVLGFDVQQVTYDNKTYSIKNISAVMDKDDYIGIALPKVMNIYEISAEVSPVESFKLQVSLNGVEWKDVEFVNSSGTLTTSEIMTEAYVRLVCLNDGTNISLNKLSVAEAYEPVVPSVSTNLSTYQSYVISQALDGSLTTNFWSATGSSNGNYLTVDMKENASLKTVELYSGINKHGVVDGFNQTQLEVSNDGIVWTKVGTPKSLAEYAAVDSTMKKLVFNAGNVEARFFRLSAVGSSDSWAKVYEIKYDAEYTDYENRSSVATNLKVYQDYSAEKAMDNDISTFAWIYSTSYESSNLGSRAGEYVEVDLGTLVPLYDASIYFGKNTKEPKYIADAFKAVKLQTSVDGTTWKDASASLNIENYVANGNCYVATLKADGSLVRYFRFTATEDYRSWLKVYEIKYNQSVNVNQTQGSLSTNMKTYQSYNLSNAMDGKLNTKFYSSAASKVNDYIQIDLGAVGIVYDVSIYFGGDPNRVGAVDGFKKMDILVSNDGSNWKTVKSMSSSEYVVVGGKYLATTNLGGIDARYVKFNATEASSSWLQVYEVQFNNEVDLNAVRFVDDAGTVSISRSDYLDDGMLHTSPLIYNVDANSTLIYPTNTIVNVTTLGVLQDADAISNASVEVQSLDGSWIKIGTLDQTWKEFEVNQHILAVKFTFDGSIQPVIYDILIEGYADYSRVNEVLNKVPQDLSLYTDVSVAALNDVVNDVVYEKEVKEQIVVDRYIKPIQKAIDGLEYKDADYTAVEAAIEAAETLTKENYVDFTAVTEAINAVVEGKKITEQSEVDAMAKAITDAIAALELKPADYTAVEAAIATAEALTKENYVNFSDVENAITAVVRGKDITKQAEVDAMAKAIEDAIAALELKPADYTAVETAKGNVPADLSIYTDETVAELNEALAAVVEGKKIDEQSVVDGYAGAIEAAILRLEYKNADYTAVNEAKAKIPTDLSLYTEETVKALEDAVNAIEELDITKQDEVDAMAEAIEEAIENLKYKPADYTSVNEAVEKIPTDLTGYTAASVQALSEAVAAIEENLDITHQAEVEAMAEAVLEAIEGLELKPVYTITEGANSVYTINQGEDHAFKCDGPFEEFVRLNLYYGDEEITVGQDDAAISKGSTIVTFTKEFLNSLKEGEYRLVLTYEEDITSECRFRIKKAEVIAPEEMPATPSVPSTGDSSNILGYGLLALLSLLGLAGLKKRRFANK